MKDLIGRFKKLKDSDYVVKSEVTGKPFFGEIIIIFNDGRIDRVKFDHKAEICTIKENIKV